MLFVKLKLANRARPDQSCRAFILCLARTLRTPVSPPDDNQYAPTSWPAGNHNRGYLLLGVIYCCLQWPRKPARTTPEWSITTVICFRIVFSMPSSDPLRVARRRQILAEAFAPMPPRRRVAYHLRDRALIRSTNDVDESDLCTANMIDGHRMGLRTGRSLGHHDRQSGQTVGIGAERDETETEKKPRRLHASGALCASIDPLSAVNGGCGSPTPVPKHRRSRHSGSYH
jgi:hypothetical protein